MIYKFKGILQKEGWQENVCIRVDADGIITEIGHNADAATEVINGYAIPGFQNAHSHAFQYAMAGLAERHEENGTQDDFWSWREAMYNLALTINPDQMEAIATMLYSEMARHGYTNVAEFHYVHHDKNGKPYANLAEMGSRLVSAAATAGIGITLVPIFYQKGGFGREPVAKQKRFISPTIQEYYKLLDSSQAACRHYNNANLAIGIHSLRGVEPLDVAEVAKTARQDLPFHIHVSEQLKEVEDSVSYLGRRPVEWLLDSIDLDERYHLVHATHLTSAETKGIAKSNANVVLCPSTEGNLGDGLFPLKQYQDFGGKWSIGTDSHVGINPFEELRLLDYGQRLTAHKRNSYITQGCFDSGSFAIDMATVAGRKAMNNLTKTYFRVGEPLNACIMDADSPLIASTALKNLNSTLVYTSDANMILGTIAYGKRVVKQNSHVHQEVIHKNFIRTLQDLKTR